MKPLLIAFTAPKQTGKTTACRSIIEAVEGCEILSFAGPLKDCASQLFPKIYMNDLKENICPATGCSYRDWAVATGDVWRSLNKSFFIDIINHRCTAALEGAAGRPVILIDDLRYLNEAKWVKDSGGFIIQLTRRGIVYDMGHATERPLDPKLVDNFCSVDDAVEFVAQIIEENRAAEVES